MSHHGDPAQRQPQSPSPSKLRWQVTFTQSLPESSLERDASAKEHHLPIWGDKERPGDSFDWSRPEEEDLECLFPLDPHVQEFLGGEEKPSVVIGVGDGPQQTSMPEPSPQRIAE